MYANLYAVHMDPDVWTEPSKFCPDRFLDETGNVIGKDRIIPFSLGKLHLHIVYQLSSQN